MDVGVCGVVILGAELYRMAGVIRLESQEQLVVRVWSADPAPGIQLQALGPV